MELFEFLMILLSIIVGLGLAEILTGYGKILREGRQSELSWIHASLAIAVFLGLLQTFWESWSLRSIEAWTFSAMLLMLGSPVLLLTITHILFPSGSKYANLTEYYFVRTRLFWGLAAATIIVGTLFRPVAFGVKLLDINNASAIPMLFICLLLGTMQNRALHYTLVPIIAIIVVLDTLYFSYLIS